LPRKKKKPSDPENEKPSFHERLEGFDIHISPFGEIKSTFEIEELNKFLNEEVEDKKIRKNKTDEEE